MAVSDREYNSLLQKYNLAVTQIGEMRDQMATKNRLTAEYEAQCEVVEKHARKLCELILAKDRSEMVLGKAKTWSSYSTDELIAKATAFFVEYVKAHTEKLQKLMAEIERRGDEIESLKMQITTMAQMSVVGAATTESVIQAARDEIERKKTAESVEKKIPPKLQEAIESGVASMVIIEEEDDPAAENELAEIEKYMTEAEGIKISASGPVVIPSKRKKEELAKKKKAALGAHVVQVQSYAEKCNDRDWAVIEAIGEFGFSLYRDIQEYIVNNSKGSKGTTRTSVMELEGMGILAKTTVPMPIGGRITLYKLTDMGARLYQFRTEKAPCPSEWERVEDEHDNLDHGYGILLVKEYLEKTGDYSQISAFNRAKPITVTVAGEKRSFVPDLVCRHKKGHTEFIEYERGNHNQVNFNAKCNKMMRASRFMYFVVTNRYVKNSVCDQIESWASSLPANTLKNVELRVCTVQDIKAETPDKWTTTYIFSKGNKPIETETA